MLGRAVKYVDAPFWMASKAARASGEVPDFQIAQLHTYTADYKRNASGIGAPTNAVLEVGGQEPETFETTLRRYYAAAPYAKRSMGALSRSLLFMLKAMLTPAMQVKAFNRAHDFPVIQNTQLALDSGEWQHTHADAAAERGLPESAVAALAV